MNSSSEAAESVIKMSLEGFEMAVRLTGSGAKNVAILLYAIMKDQRRTRGKTTLAKMLKSGKPLKIFSLKQEDLKKFSEEAKRYGILYSALVDKKNIAPDGIVDVMVKEEDANRINRIVDRFKLATTDEAQVESIIEKAKIDKVIDEALGNGIEVKTIDDKLVDEILGTKEKEIIPENPQSRKSEVNPQSDLSWNHKDKTEGKNKKPSVREKLKEIKKDLEKEQTKENKSKTMGKSYSKKKNKKQRERS